MDGIGNTADDGVFVLGATNHPWDVDVALRRPGRFDRLMLVTPPDEAAREAILRLHLRDRPIAGIDTKKLAGATDGFSGADLAYLCQSAAELALLDAARSGATRLIEMRDFTTALAGIRPSIGPWLDIASNVAQFANQSGSYDDLLGISAVPEARMSAPPIGNETSLANAQNLIRLGRHAEAIPYLTSAIAHEPENPRAWSLLAQAKLGLNDVSGALQAAQRAAAIDPGNEWPFRLIALCYRRQGKHAQAVKAARRAVAVAPNVAVTHTTLASCLVRTSLGHREASRVAAHAVAMAPIDPRPTSVRQTSRSHGGSGRSPDKLLSGHSNSIPPTCLLIKRVRG